MEKQRIKRAPGETKPVLDFTAVLKNAGIRISMDGKGRWMDNVFIERLWRSLKYEQVYLAEYATGSQARTGIDWWEAATCSGTSSAQPIEGGRLFSCSVADTGL